MTVVLRPDQTRTGVGLVQGDIGPGDTKHGRYLYVVSGCHEVEIETVVIAGKIVQQRCSRCRGELEEAPFTHVRLDVASIRERLDLDRFVSSWTGLADEEFQVELTN